MRSLKTILQVAALVFVMLAFFLSIELMGGSFKLMGKGFAETLVATTSNPFVGLFVGILATSLVQSSSTVTSMVVALVASGALSIAGAIPIVMGANIGTSVTNTIVSLGHITRKDEFRLAMAGATVHDFFNLLAVVVLFPLELMFQIVSRLAAVLTDSFASVGGTNLLSPLKLIIKPISTTVIDTLGGNGIAVLVVGLLLLFMSLRYLVKLLKSLVLGRAEQMLHKVLFSSPVVAILSGMLLTIMVQSSSITTSLMVPLVASGILTVAQIFPFVLGANVGTTITALLAGLALASTGEPAAIAGLKVAFAHLVFNGLGIVIFYPIRQLREIPIRLATKLGDLSVRNRGYALGYVLVVFFVIPVIVILATRGVDIDYTPVTPDAVEVQAVDTTASGGAAELPLAPDTLGAPATDAAPADTLGTAAPDAR